MQFTCVHAIQYSLNSCLLLLPCRSEGAPCVDWLCANVKTTVESVFVVHAVLSALLQVEHSDPILFHSFFLACEKRNKRNIRCDCSSAPQSYHLQYPNIPNHPKLDTFIIEIPISSFAMFWGSSTLRIPQSVH